MKVGKHASWAATVAPHDADLKTTSVLARRRRWHRPPASGSLRALCAMMPWRRLLSCWVGSWVVGSFAVAAPPTPSDSRGELLYATHCGSCHTAQVHWRDKTLATDWPSLRAQVLRWESNIGLNWPDGDVGAVARYLNERYYHFPTPDTKATVERLSPRAAAPSLALAATLAH
jgi:mono/diheme cytochrome c family protein